ncbi:phosphoribosylanthranilate isomerase [Massilia sp. W12]|uniref:phosphoribosylanthranilate isomerase n=1 Tax=Massilia sp. W12 TaxID=3126507 RepID=UPI0030D0422B
MKTRIKICGLTRVEDVLAAVAAGADALGFVFYEKSPRYVNPEQARSLLQAVPPFVQTVGLFVNATPEQACAVLARAPVGMLQLHGDETPQQAAALAQAAGRPFMRAFRVRPDNSAHDLLQSETELKAASPWFSALLLDTHTESYGGAGKVFDWSIIPKDLAPRAVLSGGLSVQNAAGAVRTVRPFALDVSSGVEAAKGIKDAALMQEFIACARQAI